MAIATPAATATFLALVGRTVVNIRLRLLKFLLRFQNLLSTLKHLLIPPFLSKRSLKFIRFQHISKHIDNCIIFWCIELIIRLLHLLRMCLVAGRWWRGIDIVRWIGVGWYLVGAAYSLLTFFECSLLMNRFVDVELLDVRVETYLRILSGKIPTICWMVGVRSWLLLLRFFLLWRNPLGYNFFLLLVHIFLHPLKRITVIDITMTFTDRTQLFFSERIALLLTYWTDFLLADWAMFLFAHWYVLWLADWTILLFADRTTLFLWFLGRWTLRYLAALLPLFPFFIFNIDQVNLPLRFKKQKHITLLKSVVRMITNNSNLEKLCQLIQNILNKITWSTNLTPSTNNRS